MRRLTTQSLRWSILLLSLSYSTTLKAATLSGVSMPDSITLNEQTLQLNGLGLREKYWIDIYVAGLYLPTKMSDGQKIIEADVVKRVQLQFIYSDVPKEKMVETLEENIQKNPQFSNETIVSIRKCGTWMQDFTTGDVVSFDYTPNTQTTTININSKELGRIQGKGFMEAIFAMYVGKHPATEALKSGLLGQ